MNEIEKEQLRKQRILFVIIYSAIFIVVPTAIGIPIAAIFYHRTILEALYLVFGVIALLIPLFKSRIRDSKNWKENHTIVEDKESDSYKNYRFLQTVMYIVGLITILLSIPSYFICLQLFPA